VFASAALSAEIVFTALGATGLAIVAGLVIVVAQSLFQSGRTLYALRSYDLLLSEKVDAFLNTFILLELPEKIKQITSHQDRIDYLSQQIIQSLAAHQNISAYAMGLGQITSTKYLENASSEFSLRELGKREKREKREAEGFQEEAGARRMRKFLQRNFT
jgi:hypothetical protein